jgi:glutathione S-transferase
MSNANPRYTLYCAPNTYAMGVHAILEETGADYRVEWVKLFSDTPDRAFIAASPHGRVPALAGPDGAVFESGAIALYLAEKHPQANLLIDAGDSRRGHFLQWMHYLASTLQPEVMLQFHPEFYFEEESTKAALKQASLKRLDKVLQVIDEALDPGPWFFGDRLTIVDFCFAMQAVWPQIYPGSIRDYPNIADMVDRFIDRPSARKVLIMHEETWAGAHGSSGGMNNSA